jgi:hypothetical protein
MGNRPFQKEFADAMAKQLRVETPTVEILPDWGL